MDKSWYWNLCCMQLDYPKLGSPKQIRIWLKASILETVSGSCPGCFAPSCSDVFVEIPSQEGRGTAGPLSSTACLPASPVPRVHSTPLSHHKASRNRKVTPHKGVVPWAKADLDSDFSRLSPLELIRKWMKKWSQVLKKSDRAFKKWCKQGESYSLLIFALVKKKVHTWC